MTFDDFIVMDIESSDYNMYMDAQQKIYIAILEAFEKENIEFAYPTQTLFAANAFNHAPSESTSIVEGQPAKGN